MTTQQAVTLYLTIEALRNQFRRENKRKMMKCGNCGKLIPKDQTWCPHCNADDLDD